jgi:hypothetical protein
MPGQWRRTLQHRVVVVLPGHQNGRRSRPRCRRRAWRSSPARADASRRFVARSARTAGMRTRSRRGRSPASWRHRARPTTRNRREHPWSPRSTAQGSSSVRERTGTTSLASPVQTEHSTTGRAIPCGHRRCSLRTPPQRRFQSRTHELARSQLDGTSARPASLRRHAERTRFSETSRAERPSSMRHPVQTNQVQ